MVTVQQMQEGVARYLDAELLPKIGGWKKWIAGAAATEYVGKLGVVVDAIKKKPAVAILGVVTEDGMIDADKLRDAFVNQARSSGSVSFDIPLLGTLTIGERDVETLYRYIVGGM